MEIAIRNIGNSKGVVLPKPLLAQVGLDGQTTAKIEVENGAIVLRKPAKAVRAGWAAAATCRSLDGGHAKEHRMRSACAQAGLGVRT